MRALISLLMIAPSVLAQATSAFSFNGRQVAYETFPSTGSSVLILLHGASGPGQPPYRDQARFFAQHGYTVYLPHFFDATRSSTPTDANYGTWAAFLSAFVQKVGGSNSLADTFVLGYSLGASVALAAGSQGLPVHAIAEWYGSLPDQFFFNFKSMPPLLILHGQQDKNIPVSNADQLIHLCDLKQLACQSHIYPEQQHGFDDAARIDADQRTLAFFAHPE